MQCLAAKAHPLARCVMVSTVGCSLIACSPDTFMTVTATFIGVDQAPRLLTEVPDGLPQFVIAWATTPPINLLARLLVPAPGFLRMMITLLVGQIFLRREPGVRQGENDPLTAIARAARLQ